MKSQRRDRRRCSICRRWYIPDDRTKKTQKTCSEECREKRRKKSARRRRERDLHEARVEERHRPRKSRQHRQPSEEPPKVSSQRSRAGFREDLNKIVDEIVKTVDKNSELSRAGLRRSLEKILCNFGEMASDDAKKVGQKVE